jgi:hypothetical protein
MSMVLEKFSPRGQQSRAVALKRRDARLSEEITGWAVNALFPKIHMDGNGVYQDSEDFARTVCISERRSWSIMVPNSATAFGSC